MERQKWNILIADADNITFQLENGELLNYAVEKHNMRRAEPKYEMRILNDNILYMCFEDFANPDAILRLMDTNKNLIEQTPYWIIDVRNNGGGSDSSYYPLLPYLFSKGETRKSEDLYYLMTERNCDTRIQFLRSYMETISENLQAKAGLEGHIQLFESNRGKGFMKLESSDDLLMKYFDETTMNPKKVIIMTDTFCGSSGDQFIHDVKQASKVTVIGRPTAGILDYSNVTSIVLDNAFQFMYPTSKMGSVLEKRFTYNGIEPHIYIPWTPEHIESDVDLKEAIKILERL